MSDQIIFIPGFTAFDRKVPRFIIGKFHMVFEWVMIYRDHHPACFHDYQIGKI